MLIGQFVEYRGYVGSIEYSTEDGCYHGKLLNIKDLIVYEGSNVEELYRFYHEAVDDYIDFTEAVGS